MNSFLNSVKKSTTSAMTNAAQKMREYSVSMQQTAKSEQENSQENQSLEEAKMELEQDDFVVMSDEGLPDT